MTTPKTPQWRGVGRLTTFLTVKEAAHRLRISPRSVWSLIAEGRLRPVHPTPGRTCITEKELEAYMSSLEKRRVA